MSEQGGVRERLQLTALRLFSDRGYDRTTAADIAAEVGVTERTFFRHFSDKREVLFAGAQVLEHELTNAVTAAPRASGPLDALFHAFRAVEPLLMENRPFSVPRQLVIASSPALQERELAKVAALAESLARTLESRGAAPREAALAADVGMAVFVRATVAWLDRPIPTLSQRLDELRAELAAISTTR